MKPKLKWLIAIASVGAFAGIGLGISACENKRKQNNIRKNNLLSITEPTNLIETSGYSGTWTLGKNEYGEQIIDGKYFDMKLSSKVFHFDFKENLNIDENNLKWIDRYFEGAEGEFQKIYSSQQYSKYKWYELFKNTNVIRKNGKISNKGSDYIFDVLTNKVSKKQILDIIRTNIRNIQRDYLIDDISDDDIINNIYWKTLAIANKNDDENQSFKDQVHYKVIQGAPNSGRTFIYHTYHFVKYKVVGFEGIEKTTKRLFIRNNQFAELETKLLRIWKNKLISLKSDFNTNDLSENRLNDPEYETFKTNDEILDDYFKSLKPFQIGKTTYVYKYRKNDDNRSINTYLEATMTVNTEPENSYGKKETYTFEIPLKKNQRIKWEASDKWNSLQYQKRINLYAGKRLSFDNRNSENPTFLVDDKAENITTSTPIGLNADKTKYFMGKWKYHSNLRFYFKPDDDNYVVEVNGKKVDVVNNVFEHTLIDNRQNPDDNERIADKEEDKDKPQSELNDENSHKKNEYKLTIKKYKNINTDSTPELIYEYIAVVDSKTQGLDFKYYAWDPKKNLNQKQLISPNLLDENGNEKLDDKGNPIPNPRYNPLIDKNTGTIKQLVWVDTAKFSTPDKLWLSGKTAAEITKAINDKLAEIENWKNQNKNYNDKINDLQQKLNDFINNQVKQKLENELKDLETNLKKAKEELNALLHDFEFYYEHSEIEYEDAETYRHKLQMELNNQIQSWKDELSKSQKNLQNYNQNKIILEKEIEALKRQIYKIQHDDPPTVKRHWAEHNERIRARIAQKQQELDNLNSIIASTEAQITQLNKWINNPLDNGQYENISKELDKVNKFIDHFNTKKVVLNSLINTLTSNVEDKQNAINDAINQYKSWENTLKQTKEDKMEHQKKLISLNDELDQIKKSNFNQKFLKWADKFDFYSYYSRITGLPPFGLTFLHSRGKQIGYKGFIAEATVVNKAALKQLIGETDEFFMIKMPTNGESWNNLEVLDNKVSADSYISKEGTYLFYSRSKEGVHNFKIVKIVDINNDDKNNINNKTFTDINKELGNENGGGYKYISYLWETQVGNAFANYLKDKHRISLEQAKTMNYENVKQYWELYVTFLASGGYDKIEISPKLDLSSEDWKFDYPNDFKKYLLDNNIDLIKKYGVFPYSDKVLVKKWEIDESSGALVVEYALNTANGMYSLTTYKQNYFIKYKKFNILKQRIKLLWNENKIKQKALQSSEKEFLEWFKNNLQDVLINKDDLDKLNLTYSYQNKVLTLNASLLDEYKDNYYLENDSITFENLIFNSLGGFFDGLKKENINLKNELNKEKVIDLIKNNIFKQLIEFGKSKLDWRDEFGNKYPYWGNAINFIESDFAIDNLTNENIEKLLKVYNNVKEAKENGVDVKITMLDTKFGKNISTTFKVYNYSPAPISKTIDLNKLEFNDFDINYDVSYDDNEQYQQKRKEILEIIKKEIQGQLTKFNPELVLGENVDASKDEWEALIDKMFFNNILGAVELKPLNNNMIVNSTIAKFKNSHITATIFDFSKIKIEGLKIKSKNYDELKALIISHISKEIKRNGIYNLTNNVDYEIVNIKNRDYLKSLIAVKGLNILEIVVKSISKRYIGQTKFNVINDFDDKLNGKDKDSWKKKLASKWIALIVTLSILGGIGLAAGLWVLIARIKSKKIK